VSKENEEGKTKGFELVPKDVPTRVRKSKYAEAVEDFIASNEPSGMIQTDAARLETTYQGFHKALTKNAYPVELMRVNGTLYIKRV
jgi:hypothetical protein